MFDSMADDLAANQLQLQEIVAAVSQLETTQQQTHQSVQQIVELGQQANEHMAHASAETEHLLQQTADTKKDLQQFI